MTTDSRRGFLGKSIAMLAAAAARNALASPAPATVKTDGKKPMTTVTKGLNGGKVICLSNRSHWQMSSTVFVSPSGKVAVVDGGYYADADSLHTVLTALGGVVDYWFVTHAHCDHYGAFTALLEKHPDLGGIRVGQLLHAFPETAWLTQTEPASAVNTGRFYAALRGASPAIAVNPLAKGLSFELEKGWQFEVLNDCNLDLRRPNINDTSICLSVTTGDHTWLVTGDVAVQTGNRLVTELKDRLRHEFVFMAHHGQQGANKAFYAAVQPKTAIWPTPDWLWDNDAGSGPGSGPFATNYTKCWMQELGVKEHHVLTHDVVFV